MKLNPIEHKTGIKSQSHIKIDSNPSGSISHDAKSVKLSVKMVPLIVLWRIPAWKTVVGRDVMRIWRVITWYMSELNQKLSFSHLKWKWVYETKKTEWFLDSILILQQHRSFDFEFWDARFRGFKKRFLFHG